MFKKFVSLAIVLMLVMSMAAIAASAEQVEIAEVAADTPAEVGADAGADTGAEAGSDTGASGKKIYFDASGTGWANYSLIMVYCYNPETGDVQIDWASRKKGGMTDEGNGTWSYDFDAKGIELTDGVQYSLIFNADTGAQTHDLLFTTALFGDTAVGEANQVENPADSNKKSNIARWKSGNLGPQLCITSLGHVVPESGGVIPAYTTPYKMFVAFLADSGSKGLANAMNYADGKTEQQIIDETAAALGLYKDDVEKAIAEAKTVDMAPDWTGKWSKEASSLPDGENQEAQKNKDADNPVNPVDNGGDTKETTKSSSSSSSSSSGTSSSSGGTKTGSGSSTTTGQETTVLFIMLGVMVAAAGVIFFARKKDRT